MRGIVAEYQKEDLVDLCDESIHAYAKVIAKKARHNVLAKHGSAYRLAGYRIDLRRVSRNQVVSKINLFVGIGAYTETAIDDLRGEIKDHLRKARKVIPHLH